MKGTSGKYELIIPHPSHFLMGGAPVVIKHPVTQEFANFFVSQNNSGFLHEGSPTGPRLPPFSSRGDINRVVPLNPILVNFAAIVQLRRLVRQNLQWGRGLDPIAISTLKSAILLHKAVICNPNIHPGPHYVAPIPVITLFFKPSFHPFSQLCLMFTTTVTPYFSQVQLVTFVFWFTHNQLRLVHDYILFIVMFHLFFVHTLSFKELKLCFISRYRICVITIQN